ncbi:hypothetical protein D7D52_35830 [Nocardia yunnanensis]|uniref:Uncharacterized protein n=1 Tax=Nocardia yunnanensis TaxID=2382165 RepID=A0A386ZM06_9NOCA|nr:hypothetical protein [Nocardia yunnanensis]AYF78310.1 hypothetical protein D7D52_35830 [Nocardia yunnanensis]
MSLFTRNAAPREVSVYVSVHADGHRTVSITGAVDEVGALMDQVLAYPNTSAYPVTPASPMPSLHAPWHVNGSVATEIR